MTPDLLREAGEALYGSTWQSELARGLLREGGNLQSMIRSVQRWVSGAHAIPTSLSADIRALGDRRVEGWREVRKRLPR